MSFDKLRDIFVTLFDDKEFLLDPEVALRNIKNWDSLTLISLAVSIEKVFKVKFPAADVYAIRTIADVIKLLESKGVSFAIPELV